MPSPTILNLVEQIKTLSAEIVKLTEQNKLLAEKNKQYNETSIEDYKTQVECLYEQCIANNTTIISLRKSIQQFSENIDIQNRTIVQQLTRIRELEYKMNHPDTTNKKPRVDNDDSDSDDSDDSDVGDDGVTKIRKW
jgi:chromosome segregation ATPase